MNKPKDADRGWLKTCFRQGCEAYKADEPPTANPYTEDPKKGTRWYLGWSHEKKRADRLRMTGEEARCRACRWWRRQGDASFGECRGGPPSAALEGAEQVTLWPLTEATDYCGSFDKAKILIDEKS